MTEPLKPPLSESAPGERYTKRLRLAPVSLKNVNDLLALHSDDEVAEYWGQWTVDDARKYASDFDEGWRKNGVSKWMAYDRETGEVVGRGGLSLLDVDGQERLEIGWTLRGSARGKGYATEIGRAGLEFAFNELKAQEVVSFTEPSNRASRAVMERLGMHYSHDIVHNNEPFVLYAVDRSGFKAAQQD